MTFGGLVEARDVLYIHDTLAVFAGRLDDLGPDAAELVPTLSKKARSKLRREAEGSLFQDGPLVREAHEIARASRASAPPPAALAAALRRGVPRLLHARNVF